MSSSEKSWKILSSNKSQIIVGTPRISLITCEDNDKIETWTKDF